MKKADIITENERVVSECEIIRNNLHVRYDTCEMLRHCMAWVYEVEDDNGVFSGYLLKSYNTFIAYIDENGNCYDYLRYVYGYTATSAQHISKFKHDYHAQRTYTYRPI